MTVVELTSSAQLDIAEAALGYELERPGLGTRFENELHLVLRRVADNPLLFPVYDGEARRALLRVFPYAVFFTIRGDAAWVLAVLHQHRHPSSWRRSR